jgi:hypothetical protein
MAAPKIKTLQARFGFADSDLKNPVHDDIIKWLDRNIDDILVTILAVHGHLSDVRVKWEPLVRMTEDGGQFIGFADLVAYQTNRDGFILFEAKTKIDSLGELFRQLRLYQAGYVFGQRVSGMKFVVVSPDDSNAEIIREQGFGFLKYDPNMVFKNKV